LSAARILDWFIPFVLVLAASGCSFYDVATNAVDAVAGTGLFSDKGGYYAEWDGF